MTDPNATQVGGSHYRSDFQHWDIIEDNDVGYLEGCASKYVTRWRKKGGVEDLRKAVHYLQKALTKRSCAKGMVSVDDISRFVIANEVGGIEAAILHNIFRWSSPEMLIQAIDMINHIIEREEGRG